MKRFFSIIGAVLFYLVMFPMLLVVFASTMAYASTSHLGSVIKFIPLFLLSYFVTWFTCKIVYRKASLYKTYICLILAALVVIICQYQESHKINPYLQPIKLTNPKFSDLKLTLENNFKSRMPAACAATFKLLPLSKMDKDAIDLATEMSWEVKLFSALNNSFKVKNFRNTCKNFKIEDVNEVSCPSLLINDLLKKIRTTEAMELMILGGIVTATFSNGKMIKDLLPEKEATIGQIKLTNDMLELVVERSLRIIQPIKPGKYYYGFELVDGSFTTELYKTAVKECSLTIFSKFNSIFNNAEESTKRLIEKNHLSSEQLNGQLERLYNIKKTWEDATKNMNIENMKNEIQKSNSSLIVNYEKSYSMSHLFASSKDFAAILDSFAKTGSDKITTIGDKPVDLKKE